VRMSEAVVQANRSAAAKARRMSLAMHSNS
jgi:hypothetical protein